MVEYADNLNNFIDKMLKDTIRKITHNIFNNNNIDNNDNIIKSINKNNIYYQLKKGDKISLRLNNFTVIIGKVRINNYGEKFISIIDPFSESSIMFFITPDSIIELMETNNE